MKQAMIIASSLCVRFDQQTILDEVNFTVGQGEVFALVYIFLLLCLLSLYLKYLTVFYLGI